MLLELESRKGYLERKNISTIYFGGGTPSILSSIQLERFLNTIKKHFTCDNKMEITIECNPDDLSDKKLNELKNTGFNRLSIGVQSFNDDELKWMNRAHTENDSVDSVKRAQDSGFNNITIDLIYGSKFQTLANWEQTLIKAAALNIQHISAYNLTIEDKTKLGVDFKRKVEPEVNDDFSAEQFKMMIEFLSKENFIHYEISNFGKEGFISQHNSNYWKGVPYLGIGPSAHSYDGENRQWNISSNTAYISKINNNEIYFEKEILSTDEKFNEYILTGLRTIWGCDKNYIENKFGFMYLQKLNSFIESNQDSFHVNGSVVSLTDKGKLFADYISKQLFV